MFACLRVCVCVYPFKLGFRVIYLILDSCRQTARILTNYRSTRYENETVVCLLRGFRVIYLILDRCRGYADLQGHETRGGIKPLYRSSY